MGGSIESPLPLSPRAEDRFFNDIVHTDRLVEVAQQRIRETEEYMNSPIKAKMHMVGSKWTDAHTFAPSLSVHYALQMLEASTPTSARLLAIAGYVGSVLMSGVALSDMINEVRGATKLRAPAGYPSYKTLPPEETEIIPSIDLEVGEYVKASHRDPKTHPVIEIDVQKAGKVFDSVSREDTKPSLVHLNIALFSRRPNTLGVAGKTRYGASTEVGILDPANPHRYQSYTELTDTTVHELTHAADFSSQMAQKERNNYNKTWKRGAKLLLSIAAKANILVGEETVKRRRYLNDPWEIRAREMGSSEQDIIVYFTSDRINNAAQTTKK